MFWEEHLKRVVVILRKRLPMQLLLHLDNSQVQRIHETSLPMIGSMVAVWCDTPSEEYIEKNVFDLMEAFANHNKDYFQGGLHCS